MWLRLSSELSHTLLKLILPPDTDGSDDGDSRFPASEIHGCVRKFRPSLCTGSSLIFIMSVSGLQVPPYFYGVQCVIVVEFPMCVVNKLTDC